MSHAIRSNLLKKVKTVIMRTIYAFLVQTEYNVLFIFVKWVISLDLQNSVQAIDGGVMLCYDLVIMVTHSPSAAVP